MTHFPRWLVRPIAMLDNCRSPVNCFVGPFRSATTLICRLCPLASRVCLAFCLLIAASAAGNAEARQVHANLETAQHVGIERVFPRLRFHRPVFLTGAHDGSGRVFVTEQDGLVHVFAPGDSQTNEVSETRIFLDIRDRISRQGNEEGLIGFAFHPDFKNNGEFFVHYSSSVKDMTGVVSRFRVLADDPNRADPESEEVILEQSQPYRNHNGGSIEFGPDGFLYISFGDGGLANDPHGHGQNLQSWLGKIIRIDVNNRDEGKAFAVPADNPFVDTPKALPEIWALGLRNAWRFSFDSLTGEIWAGDVGQDRFDEVSIIRRGGNYGWNRYEAKADFKNDAVMATPDHDEPVTFYGREWGISVTGGYVYRGQDFPQLLGSYFYGDYATGNLWRVKKDGQGNYANELVRRTGRSIASFGIDDRGELYLLSFDGGIYRIVPTDQPENTFADWPPKLSETGIFASMKDKQVADHLVAYSVNAPFWSDGAEKSRFLILPEGQKLGYRESGSWSVPVGTTIVKNFLQPGRSMLETRLIKRTEGGWESATYVWDTRTNQEAILVPGGQQFEIATPDRKSGSWQIDSWHAPSASECAACHVDGAGYVLGLNTAQLNGEFDGKNQIADLAARGMVDLPAGFDAQTAERFCSPLDPSAGLEDRVRVYLDVNCAMCHRPEGTGNAKIDLRFDTALGSTGLIGENAAQGNLGIADAKLVEPGNPDKSLLLHRIETLGAGRMPDIGSNLIDQDAVKLLREWITNLK